MKNKASYILLLLIVTLSAFGLQMSQIQEVQSDIVFEVLQRNGSDVHHFWTSDDVLIPTTYTEKDTEFRGVWVATVYNLNMPTHTSETQYKAAFQDLVDELKESNMNAMLFQVRPLNDAFYDSAYAPYSRYLDGTEGSDPGWDVLQYMIDTCHANGIEFHAWMNPYRVANTTMSQTSYINTLHAENFAKINPHLVVSGNVDSHGRNPLILNPGEPAVKTYIRDVVTELITNYNVDGIHFDDYFYPYSGISSDTTTYNTYKLPGQSIEDWRRENINEVVSGIKSDIDAYNDTNNTDLRFGISPFGLWGSGIEGYSQTLPGGSNTGPTNLSSYHSQYADSKRWVEEGWLHYICPQVYWNFTHSTAPYADVVDWWAEISRGTGVDVIIGHAPSAASSGSWLTEEISDQLRYNQKHPEIKGSVMYSASYLDYAHMQYVELHNWTTTPLNTWETSNVEAPDISISGVQEGNIYIEDVTVTLTSTDAIQYKINDGAWTDYTAPFMINGEGAHVLYVKTIDGLGVESPVSSFNIPIQYINNVVPEYVINGSQIGDNYVLGTTITFTATEDIYVAINHGNVGEFELYTEPIVLDDTGGYYIRAKTTDSNGTDSEEVIISLTVQEECYDVPVVNMIGTGPNNTHQSLTLELTSDTTIEYNINDQGWMSYTSSLVFDVEGNYNVKYRNTDTCGVINEVDFVIDTTPPTEPTITVTGDYDGTRYYTSTTNIALSGEGTIYYRIHNGSSWTSWDVYTESFDLVFTADYYVAYYSVDEAGNQSNTLEERVRLQIPPSEDSIYIIRDGEIVNYYGTGTPIMLPSYTEKSEEIRAVWVATVSNIDIGQHTSEEQYKGEIIAMLDNLEYYNFNTIFFQTRPMNDAFYDSNYAPWSRYLTGTEGGDPGWDVLAILIEEAHIRGIEVHAWLNPYRVSSGTEAKDIQLSGLHDDNFAKKNPDLVMVDGAGKLILNPGERQVQVYIRNVIQELITQYDIDGIHFDDYFYSYNGTPNSEDNDLYLQRREPGQTLEDWRRENINTVVREIHELITLHNANNNTTVEFGISPFGIWKSGEPDGSNTSPYTLESYTDQFADSKKWVEEGWVDYILPQLYWEFDHTAAPFADLVDWWNALCEANNVDLIIGHGFYRYIGDSWGDENELPEQLRYINDKSAVIGSSFFSYKTLLSSDTEVQAVLQRLQEYYYTDYVTFPWPSVVEKQLRCDPGYHIEGDTCVQDPVVCDPGYYEKDGYCVLEPVCEIGEELINHECVFTDVCPQGYYVEDGRCEAEPVCEIGEELIDHECVPQSSCPEGFIEIPGGCKKEDTPLPTAAIVGIVGGGVSVTAALFFVIRKYFFKI